jgi:hydrogenase maturation protein HypF
VIDVEGAKDALDAFERRVVSEAPPAARIEACEAGRAVPSGARGFEILESALGLPHSARVVADLATCDDCLREFQDPLDRRYRYPFINCTACGPRFSIARAVPYDRERTTMSAFRMCGACEAEYHDPRSRRFHAQPNACAVCGPALHVFPAAGDDPLAVATRALREGAIVAVKGLGGFHLACDASNDRAVRRLRERKRRPENPFAVMFRDPAAARVTAEVGDAAERALLSARRPIVLLPLRDGHGFAPSVAPGLREVGAFLPYTPVQHALLADARAPLVMTSGNLTDEPIAAANEEALTRLRGVADLFLLHDRDVHMREDDSVARVIAGKARVIRRGRGFVPDAIPLGFEGPQVLAVGGDLKNALCLTTGDAAILSQHIGDLEHPESQDLFREVRGHLEALFDVRPTAVAHDLHPGYHSTAIARASSLPLVPVQHHHAHVASCLVENGRSHETVIGVAWDGTGHGTDGTSWGGEFLVGGLGASTRVGRIRPTPQPGSDAAARNPWRMALSHAREAGLEVPGIHPDERAVRAQLERDLNCPRTSSAGRLFDAVASLCGLRHEMSYEGQAAMELEAAAVSGGEPYAFDVLGGDVLELDPRPVVRAIVADLGRGESVSLVAARFHATMAAAIVRICRTIRDRTRLSTVALSGGCFQNGRLTEDASALLSRDGFEVLLHREVPAGDGGLALGQAAVAAWTLRTAPAAN